MKPKNFQNLRKYLLYGLLIIMVMMFFSHFPGGNDQSLITVREFEEIVEKNKSTSFFDVFKNIRNNEQNYLLEGHISSSYEDGIYNFRDTTGTIKIRIDDPEGIELGKEDNIQIFGSADYIGLDLIIEVEKVKILN